MPAARKQRNENNRTGLLKQKHERITDLLQPNAKVEKLLSLDQNRVE